MIVYELTNVVTGKRYVGMTTLGLAQRWRLHVNDAERRRHNYPLANAIRKHGPAAFSMIEIASATSRDDLRWLERELIRERGTMRPRGYNVASGGEGATGVPPTPAAIERIRMLWKGKKLPEEVRRKISAAGKGKKRSPEFKAKVSAALKGRTFSDTTRAKLSDAQRRRPPDSAETRARKAASGKSKSWSPVHRARLSAAARRRWADPARAPALRAAIKAGQKRRKDDRRNRGT